MTRAQRLTVTVIGALIVCAITSSAAFAACFLGPGHTSSDFADSDPSGGRSPLFGDSDESMTLLAILAMLPAASTGDDSAKAVRDKGIQWLSETKTDGDPQSIAMRLVLWRRLGRPAIESEPLVQSMKGRQNPDGGWSQTKDMGSDAWATGQALYALAHAGIKPDDPVVARAHIFLIKTQRDDGSWPMTSRPVKPGGEGSKSLIPITCAGSAWAILGLARSR